ncbi:MAG: hypothetical protein AAGD88_07995 [Bacteroidota bacterium]
MLFIYNKRGILVPVYSAVSVFGTLILNGILKSQVGGIFAKEYDGQIVLGIGLFIAFVWTYRTSYDYVEVDGEKERVHMNHHLFYISNRLWSYIMLGGSLLALAGGILETFRN